MSEPTIQFKATHRPPPHGCAFNDDGQPVQVTPDAATEPDETEALRLEILRGLLDMLCQPHMKPERIGRNCLLAQYAMQKGLTKRQWELAHRLGITPQRLVGVMREFREDYPLLANIL